MLDFLSVHNLPQVFTGFDSLNKQGIDAKLGTLFSLSISFYGRLAATNAENSCCNSPRYILLIHHLACFEIIAWSIDGSLVMADYFLQKWNSLQSRWITLSQENAENSIVHRGILSKINADRLQGLPEDLAFPKNGTVTAARPERMQRIRENIR